MTSPLRKTKDPKQNAPAWAAGIATALTIVLTVVSDLDLPGWAVAVIAILIVGSGVASQFFTTPGNQA